MRFVQWVRLAGYVGRPGSLAPSAVTTCLALGERLLGPVLVHVATRTGAARAFVVGGVLGLIFAVRGSIERTEVARTESALYERVVDSVFRQDVLQPSVLPDEEARAALFEGASGVARLLAAGLPNLVANMVAAAAFAGFAALTQPTRVILVAALSATLGTALVLACRRFVEVAQQKAWSVWGDLADGISNAFDGRLEIVAAGRADEYLRSFAAVASSWAAATIREARLGSLAGRLPVLALTLAVGAAVVLDSALRGEPAGHTLEEAALLASMAPAFVGVAHGLQELVNNDRRLKHMRDLMTAAPRSFALPNRSPVQGDVHSVELRDVHFEYERSGRRHEAIRGVSFTWRAGELLALAGPNGSGKSTCLRVLLGLAKPSAGDVIVDGVPLERTDIDGWRRRIAFLPQRPYLPSRATVRDCLRFIDSDVTDEIMGEAVERADLSRVLRREAASPLDVRIDELSVGQRQRVGLARLLCRRAPMILLDEPDANLDRAGVEFVAELVRELAGDRMVIVVAHSPALLGEADRVLTLDSGKIGAESTRRPA